MLPRLCILSCIGIQNGVNAHSVRWTPSGAAFWLRGPAQPPPPPSPETAQFQQAVRPAGYVCMVRIIIGRVRCDGKVLPLTYICRDVSPSVELPAPLSRDPFARRPKLLL